MQYEFMIGTTQAGMTNVEALSTPLPAPDATYQAYEDQIQLGSGAVRGVGPAICTWHWGFITSTQRAALRAFCTGAAATVYIKTMDDSLAYHTYRATMIWPQAEEVDAGRLLDVEINFKLWEQLA